MAACKPRRPQGKRLHCTAVSACAIPAQLVHNSPPPALRSSHPRQHRDKGHAGHGGVERRAPHQCIVGTPSLTPQPGDGPCRHCVVCHGSIDCAGVTAPHPQQADQGMPSALPATARLTHGPGAATLHPLQLATCLHTSSRVPAPAPGQLHSRRALHRSSGMLRPQPLLSAPLPTLPWSAAAAASASRISGKRPCLQLPCRLVMPAAACSLVERHRWCRDKKGGYIHVAAWPAGPLRLPEEAHGSASGLGGCRLTALRAQ